MKTPRSSTETLIAAMRILSRDIQSGDGVANAAIAEAAQRLDEMQSLIDGAYDIVEIWPARSDAQIAWRKDWMEKARAAGAQPS